MEYSDQELKKVLDNHAENLSILHSETQMLREGIERLAHVVADVVEILGAGEVERRPY